MAEPRRRPALDEVKKKEILAILAQGCSRSRAAQYVGCSPSTIRRAALREPQFAAALTRAEAQSELTCLTNVRKAGKKEQYWRAAAWVLERRHPEDYALRKPGTVTVQQLIDVLKQVTDILMDETTDPRVRQRIRRRVHALGQGLCLMAGVEREA
jgi:transposase